MEKDMDMKRKPQVPFEGHIGIVMGYSPNNGQPARKVLETTI